MASYDNHVTNIDMPNYFGSDSFPGLERFKLSINDFLKVQSSLSTAVPRGSLLVSGPSGCGKTSSIQSLVNKFPDYTLKTIDCADLISDSSSVTVNKITNAIKLSADNAPVVCHMTNIHLLGKSEELRSDDFRVSNSFKQTVELTVRNTLERGDIFIFVGETNRIDSVCPAIKSFFLVNVDFKIPIREERIRIFKGLLSSLSVDCVNSCIDSIADRTAGMVLGDFVYFISIALEFAVERHFCETDFFSFLYAYPLECVNDRIVTISNKDFFRALDFYNFRISLLTNAPTIPSVYWEDVGGLHHVKDCIRDLIELPLRHSRFLPEDFRRSGIMLHGPPGNGKTLVAKAIATECSLNFYSVKGPELLDMYIGQSEKNVRDTFSIARNAAPCILFFDELDALAPTRGRAGDSGGVMDRIVSQLLTEIDAIQVDSQVFLVGSSNRPDLVDPALLRPGRFDRQLYVGIPENKDKQKLVLKAVMRNLKVSERASYDRVIQSCPRNMTGADFYALSVDSLMSCIRKHINAGSTDNAMLIVEEADMVEAVQNLVPSISLAEISSYESGHLNV